MHRPEVTENYFLGICLCVYVISVPLGKICFLMNWSILVKECITNIGIPLDISGVLCFLDFLHYDNISFFGSLLTSQRCIIGRGRVRGCRCLH